MYEVRLQEFEKRYLPIVFKDNNILKSKYLHNNKFKKLKNIKFNKKINIKQAFLYIKRFDYNWRHFLLETFFSISNNLDKTIIILKDSPKYIKDILKILNIKDIIYLEKDTDYNIKDLIIEESIYNKDFLDLFINNCYKLSNIKTYDNIYISRKKTNFKQRRPVSNINILEDRLKELEFKEIIPEDLNLYEQVVLINSSKKVVNLIGANCDNIIFTKEECIFYIIYPNNCKKWAEYYTKHYKQKPKLLKLGIKTGKSTDGDKYNCPYKLSEEIITYNF